MDLSTGWGGNYDLFIEIGAASSICTRLVRASTPKRIEENPIFRRFLHYMPVLATALFLGGIYLFPSGGIVVLHSVTIGGMSGNLRDVFNLMIKRQSAGTLATEAKATLENSAAGALDAVKDKATEKSPPASSAAQLPSTSTDEHDEEKGA